MKILIVEDEIALGQAVMEYLTREQMLCEFASNLKAAKDKLLHNSYDIIVLDIQFPDGNGVDFLEWIKMNLDRSQVILLSAQHQLETKLRGLDAGADDYITKPFDLPELSARIKAVYRRVHGNSQKKLQFNNLVIDVDALELRIEGNLVNLTKKEIQLLLFFIANKNRVVSRQAIANHLWGDYTDNLDNFDFVYQHVKNLRRKIVEAQGIDGLQTVYGIGYKMEEVVCA